jgi:hypothetical protein
MQIQICIFSKYIFIYSHIYQNFSQDFKVYSYTSGCFLYKYINMHLYVLIFKYIYIRECIYIYI